MVCYVYKGHNKENHYLYLAKEFSADELPENFPKSLLSLLGELSLVVKFELTDQRKLPQADPKKIRSDIAKHGFYLQMPKEDMAAMEDHYFN